MKRIVLVSCASKKLNHKTKAQDIYISQLFKYNLRYAKSLNHDKIFILSAKHHLLELEQEIEPYNKTLNNMHLKDIKKWANNVKNQLNSKTNLKKDQFIFLAGDKYRKHLIPYTKNYKVPLKGMGIGKQLKYLKENVKNE